MLAKEIDAPFDNKEWIFEIKWDGYRAISEINKKRVKLYSRKGNSFLSTYPIIAKELQQINENVIIDGEIVVLDDEGKPNFQKLQDYRNHPQYTICYYVFDILSFKGKKVCLIPLIKRKELLKNIMIKSEIVKYADHVSTKGISFFKAAKQKKLEGIIAKKSSSYYYPGQRSIDWLKIKMHKTQEAIICGFTQPSGSRKFFGALVLGIKENNHLKYVGHSGSGFNQRSLQEVYNRLQSLIQKKSPFNQPIKTNMPVTWVKPQLVCEVNFTEWTNDKKMRHPIFLRLRDDKPIKEVTMDNIIPIKKAEIQKQEQDEKIISFGKTKVKTTHLQKIFWSNEGITKGMIIDYYQQIANYILPYLKNRPQSLKRNPNGIIDKGFYHKDAGDEAPFWIKTVELYSESTNKNINYIVCNNKATLAYLNNLGCIEINPWNSTIENLDKPDYLIIDIDPSSKNSFAQVIETANVFKQIIDKAGAKSFCKTSGMTGLHIYIPTGKKYTYDQIRDFAELLCILTHEQLPKFTTLERNVEKRGNKIYLDYLQNRKGQTICSVYSARPYKQATVSTPLLWKEVKEGLNTTDFTIMNIPKRLGKMGDIFSEVLGKGIDLKKCLKAIT